VAVSSVGPGAGVSNVTGPSNFTATWTLATQTLTLEVKCGATIGVGDRVSLMIGAEYGLNTPADGVRLNDLGFTVFQTPVPAPYQLQPLNPGH